MSVCARERERERERKIERERKRETERERERERLQRSPTCTSLKCCGFPLNRIPTCAYSLQTHHQSSLTLLAWQACLRGLPTSAASNQLKPLLGGPAMVMKPFPDLPKHISLEGGARTYTHTHTHTHSLAHVKC